MEIIAACLLGFLAGAVVSICTMFFLKSGKPVQAQQLDEEPTEVKKWQEQFDKLLNYNGKENGGM
jgi:hypothetical protein